MYFIYTLADPRTNKVAYVGITNNAYARFKQHLSYRDTNGKKIAWIQALQAEKLIPSIAIIESVEFREEAESREKYWIHFYLDQGIELVNMRIDPIASEEKVVIQPATKIEKAAPPPPVRHTVMRRDEANLRVRLEYWRKERGKSAERLAKDAHISIATISRIENEHLMPRPDVLERLTQALGVTMAELIIDITEIPAA